MRKLTAEQIRGFVSNPTFHDKGMLSQDLSWPRVSIVTPSYNQGRFLERTILSVLNQDYPNLEYIIMDGGSTDNSIEVIGKYEKSITCWVSEKDEGQADAIRRGFEKSTGTILAYLNSDDVYLPETLHRVVRQFGSRPDTAVVYGNQYLTNEDDQILGERRYTPYVPVVSRLGFLYGGFGISQPTAFWRREAYDRVGGIEPGYVHCMDTDLFVRFALHRAQFHYIREYLAGARIHKASKTCTLRSVAREEGRLINVRYRQNRSRLLAFSCLTLVRMVRLCGHIAQGDAAYLLRRHLASEVAWVP